MNLSRFLQPLVGCAALLVVLAASARAAEPPPPQQQPAFLLHLPGVAGDTSLDRSMLRGLADGGVDAEVELYDWTCGDPGIDALWARQRNDQQAQIIADRITRTFRENPRRPIFLTSHSGGTGIAVWALEKLPDDVKVQSLMLLAPALSPTYDLSNALRHVVDHAYAFSSRYDVAVLGAGTRMFGTMDGVKTDSAGLVGFVRPDGSDAKEYLKLIAMPYDTRWMRIGNIGDHIGTLSRNFAREVLAAMLLGKASAAVEPAAPPATTQPVSADVEFMP